VASGRRLAAIMFADLVGFTSMAQADEAGALRFLRQEQRRVRPILRHHHGREVKALGDGFLAEFSSALDAVNCALELQRATDAGAGTNRSGPSGRLRIGIHLGDVVPDGRDLLGDAVNVASRIEPLADPGGICVSQQVVDQVANKVRARLTRLAPRELKNVRTPIAVYKFELADSAPAPPAAPARRRVAVLPMENLGDRAQDEYLADGLTEELILRLSRLQGLHVLARSSVMRYKATTKSVGEVARELGVEAVLQGSVRRAGDRLRIAALLVDPRTEEPVWSQGYDRLLKDAVDVQCEIAERIAGALQVRLAEGETEKLARGRTHDPEAYAAYLRGRYHWNRRTSAAFDLAIGEYEDALRRDPTYAAARAGLADVHAARALLEFARPTEAFPAARREAEQAIALDPSSPEAYTSLGVVRYQFDRDWAGAESAFRTAIDLNPRYPPAHHQFADLLKAVGRLEEAMTEVRAALELDPLSLPINTGVGHVLYLSRRYPEAIEQYRRTLELDPTFVLAHLWFGRPYLELGRFAEAIRHLRTARRLSHGSTMATAMLAHAYASAGRRREALELLRRLRARAEAEYVPSYWVGLVYVGLGDADAAFRWFDRAYAERSSWLTWMMVEPRFDRLRADPRFDDLLGRMNLRGLAETHRPPSIAAPRPGRPVREPVEGARITSAERRPGRRTTRSTRSARPGPPAGPPRRPPP